LVSIQASGTALSVEVFGEYCGYPKVLNSMVLASLLRSSLEDAGTVDASLLTLFVGFTFSFISNDKMMSTVGISFKFDPVEYFTLSLDAEIFRSTGDLTFS